MSRRKILLLVWFIALATVGFLICDVTGEAKLGWAAALSLLTISLGVPLMRAFTEFSK